MIIGQFSLNCELKRKDIELNTGLKRTAIGDLLRSLIDNKFIISVENGRNQKYKINPIIFIN
jgi:sugar-specific transcriptional regulator TrmB